MEVTLAELLLLAAVCALVYKLLRPFQRWLQERMMRAMLPDRRRIVDVKHSHDKSHEKH